MNPQLLKGRVALVTGAGRRIGRAIALKLGQAGANVAVNYNTSKADALNAVCELSALGVEAVALRADVSRADQVRRMFRAVESRFGRLDILVNNAAVFFRAPFEKLTGKNWDRILNINLKGTFFCAQGAARLMRRQKYGRIINVSSLGGIQAWPEYMHYCSSKAAVIMLTRCLAKALAPNIQVNSVAPGTILIPGEEADGRFDRLLRSTPLERAGRPDDVAEMVLYLAAYSDFITGQVFVVDGGRSIP